MFNSVDLLVGTIVFLAAVVGLAAGVYQFWGVYKRRVPRKISWASIERGILTIAAKMRSDNFVPDLIVCIGRSGAILGGLIAGNMRNLPIALLDRKFCWDKNRREYVQSEFTDVHIDSRCKRILVVVGEVYSGQTLVECMKRLDDTLTGKQVRTCTLVKSRTAVCNVDYYAFEVEKLVRPAWVITSEYVRYESPQHPVRSS